MLAGIFWCLIGFVLTAEKVHFELDALATTAEVLEVQQDKTPGENTVYQLKLRWTHQDGTIHETIPRVRASYYNFPIGTELAIQYDPNDPTDVRIEMQESPWHFSRLGLIGSLITFLLGRLLRGNPEVG